MPTINCSMKDLFALLGKKLKEQELVKILEYAKAELDDKAGDNLTIELNDTNQPYLWSVEGLARHLKAAIGKSKGYESLTLEKSDVVVKVDKSVSRVRPFIGCFMAKGPALTDYQLQQLIQLQEKLALSFGRKRQKVAAGLFPAGSLSFPLLYKAVSPKSVSFVPLGTRSSMNLQQVLEKHPKGVDYGWILKDMKKYPVVLNGKREVLTFPPITNSETLGKLQPGDKEIFVEVTGTDLQAVNLAAVIFAYVFADRNYRIYPAKIQYGSKSYVTPDVKPERFKFDRDVVDSLLGVSVSESELKNLLERAQYKYLGKSVVEIPPYRKDILHSVDVAEDVAIMTCYDNVASLPLTSYTVGGTLPIQDTIDTMRVLLIGFGYQEMWSAVLSSKDLLMDRMNLTEKNFVEIENVMSATYSCLRSWLLPVLMDVLSKNRHVDYPQRLFEQGIVTVKDGKELRDEEHVAAVSAHSASSFTEMKQLFEAVLRNQSVEYIIDEFDLGCFIPGRAAKVIVNKKQVGFFGEIHPIVLERFGLTTPVVGGELNLSLLKE